MATVHTLPRDIIKPSVGVWAMAGKAAKTTPSRVLSSLFSGKRRVKGCFIEWVRLQDRIFHNSGIIYNFNWFKLHNKNYIYKQNLA
jgi:hypothetical protein